MTSKDLGNKYTTVGEAIEQAKEVLQQHSESANLDAQVLLAHILGIDRGYILTHPEQELSEQQSAHLSQSIAELGQGVPLPYVLGKWEFFGLPFYLTPDVLIPRPETELLVETALNWLANNPGRSRILDIGTGSGCIAVSIAANYLEAKVAAVDISVDALAVAEKNIVNHKLSERVQIIKSDLLSNVRGKFDLVCANLPYIPSATLKRLAVYQREPSLALDGGADGLNLITQLLDSLPRVLAEKGMVLLEIDISQAESSRKLAERQFPNAIIDILNDLSDRPRLLSMQT